MEKENYESSKIIITDDNNDSNLLYDITDRIFELRDQLSLDIISKNIIENIDNPVTYRTINYVTKFKENYNRIKEENLFNNDLEIINEYFAELSQLILTKLSLKFNVTIGNNINDDTVMDIDSYIDKLETMYEFFVVRRYDNIRDYFKVQLLKNKINFVEALELSFKQTLETYPTYTDEIRRVRVETYIEIINRLSKNFGIRILYDSANTDLRYLASNLYDLLVTRYDDYVFAFLYNFIVSQKEVIYSSLGLEKNKKIRDVGTMYNREYFEDQHLAVINANLVKVLNMISGLDIAPNIVLQYMRFNSSDVTTDAETIDMNGFNILQYIDPSTDLFRVMILPLLQNQLTFPSIVSYLNLEIQKVNQKNANPFFNKE